ncbi:hypothetical protein [Candidatus Oleimmundimicrobium sp.]|uniref:hypothetical protein n=1 Tax=Candidatus Oleimmundimicrobium sp. TaxID=3060597 RepID=UPI00272064CD|nr:hypothetical protein [Candidatus Oleimmundimicrobium sp.]MDO8885741.1 hypothetical protein [Candidatus Oleimmundimicrobium sp.]
MDKIEKEIDEELKNNQRKRFEAVLERFAFALVDFKGISSDEYKNALKIAVAKLEQITEPDDSFFENPKTLKEEEK